jgi:hypothetical protein
VTSWGRGGVPGRDAGAALGTWRRGWPVVLAGGLAVACSSPRRAAPTASADGAPAVVLQLMAVVAAEKPADPVEEIGRQLLLARAAAEGRERQRARELLDAVAPGIGKLPTIDPEDKEGKRINFRRADLRLEWIRTEARLDPAKALDSTLEYAKETNPTYHAIALGGLLEAIGCEGAGVKAAVEANARMLFEPIREGVEARTWVASHATEALPVVARAARLCGLNDLGADARTVAKRALRLFEETELRVRACRMAAAVAETAAPGQLPQAIETLASYRLEPRNRFEGTDRCNGEKLAFAAGLVDEVKPADPAWAPLAELVAEAVFRLEPEELTYGHCGMSASLARLAALNPSAVSKGMGLVLDSWSKGSRVDGYCHVASEAARGGRALADAGSAPGWLCSTLSLKPVGAKLGEEQQAVLRRERVLAAVELGDRCPGAAPELARLQEADLDLLTAARTRQLELERREAKTQIAADLRRLPPGDRYAYARALLPAFWPTR